MVGRRSVQEAINTRRNILMRAADMASVEGLEGLTVGRLATGLDMSKAGVLGHFGTKEELQLATLEYAAEVFRTEVWDPVSQLPAGLPRLLGICDTWMGYAARPAFPGGCFIASVSFEFDSRPGRVRDALSVHMRRWRDQLAKEISTAVAAGELSPGAAPEQLAQGLEAIAARVTPTREIYGDAHAAEHAKELMLDLLGVPKKATSARKQR